MWKDWVCQRGAWIFSFTASYSWFLADNSDFSFALPAMFNAAEAKQERCQLDARVSRLLKTGESCAKGEGKPRTDIRSDYLTWTRYRQRPKLSLAFLHFLANSMKLICNFEPLPINCLTYSQLSKRIISPTAYTTVIYSETSLNLNLGRLSLHPRGCPPPGGSSSFHIIRRWYEKIKTSKIKLLFRHNVSSVTALILIFTEGKCTFQSDTWKLPLNVNLWVAFASW